MRIVIVGGGKLGMSLAEMLAKEKNDLVVIERDEKKAEKLAEELDALVLHGDAADREILKDADMEKCDAVIALTGDDKTNLMACETAKSMKVPKLIARINDSGNEDLFKMHGISFVNTTKTAITEFKRALENGDRKAISLVCGGRGEILEFYVKPKSKIIDSTVESLLEKKIVVCAVLRKDKFIPPNPQTKIRERDTIAVCIPVGNRKKLENLAEK
jgi:trk system potassium uptake protein TrkA